MADQVAQRERLIAKRTEALAIVYLTRRGDLTIHEVGGETGLDLVVRIPSDRKEPARQFAVQLKGVWRPVTKEHADNVLRPAVREAQGHGPFTFPVLLLFFTMDDDRGWYTWLAEPVVRAGRALLLAHQDADCRPLDNGALDEIVARVDRWYDVRSRTSVVGSANGALGGGNAGGE